MPSGSNSKAAGASHRLNSLGVNTEALEKLVGMMGSRGDDSIGKLRRTYVRWPFACPTVDLRVEQPGGAVTVVTVVGRDLSATGIGLLHSHFIYPGSVCSVTLTDKMSVQTSISGKIMRCQHFSGVVHEVGVQFDQDIDPRQFIASDRVGHGAKLESLEPSRLTGRVLHVDDSTLDAKLLKHNLRETSIKIEHAGSFEQGLEMAMKERYDLIVTDQMLDAGNTGIELIRKIREQQPNTAIVALTAHDSAQLREQFKDVRANAVLGKPISSDTLIQTISEFLSIRPGDGEEIRSSLSSSDPSFELVPDFIDDLRQKADQLQKLISDEDAMTAYALCLQIGGVAPPLGFEDVAYVANKAAESLAATMSVEESIRDVRAIIDCCLRVSE